MAPKDSARHPDALTPREDEVLNLIRQNQTNPQIAEALNISTETVKQHVSQILAKLNVTTREQAAAWRPPERERQPWPARRWAVALGSAAVIAATIAVLALLAWGAAEDAEEHVISTQTASATPTVTSSGQSTNSPTKSPTSTATPNTRTPPPSLDLGVYAISSDGLNYRTLLPGFETRDVTPDGRYLAGAEFCLAPAHLKLVDTITGSSRELTTLDGIVAQMKIAPDGRNILIGVINEENPRTPLLYLVDAEGNVQPQVSASSIGWSSDSRHLNFVSTQADGNVTLSVREVATGNVTDLATAPYISSAIWSPDSQRLAYLTASEFGAVNHQIWSWDMPTATAQVLPGDGTPVQWFPDGESIAVLGPGGQNLPLLRLYLDGSPPDSLGDVSGFAISPDGQHIARRIFVGPQTTELRISGSEPEIVLQGAVEPAGDMAFSPDSQTLAFIGQEYIRNEQGRVIDSTGVNPYSVKVDGSNLTKLADTVQSTILGWAPDGAVLFASVRGVGCEDPFG